MVRRAHAGRDPVGFLPRPRCRSRRGQESRGQEGGCCRSRCGSEAERHAGVDGCAEGQGRERPDRAQGSDDELGPDRKVCFPLLTSPFTLSPLCEPALARKGDAVSDVLHLACAPSPPGPRRSPSLRLSPRPHLPPPCPPSRGMDRRCRTRPSRRLYPRRPATPRGATFPSRPRMFRTRLPPSLTRSRRTLRSSLPRSPSLLPRRPPLRRRSPHLRPPSLPLLPQVSRSPPPPHPLPPRLRRHPRRRSPRARARASDRSATRPLSCLAASARVLARSACSSAA